MHNYGTRQFTKLRHAFFIVYVVFSGLLLAFLRLSTESITISQEWMTIVLHLQYFFLCAIIVLAFRTFFQLHSRDYLYLFIGASTFIVISVYHSLSSNLIGANSVPKQIGGFYMFFCLIVIAFSQGKVLMPRKRKRIFWLTTLIFFSAGILAVDGLAFTIKPFINQQDFSRLINRLFAIIHLLLLTIAIARFLHNYRRTRHLIQFLYIASAVSFILSVIPGIFYDNIGDQVSVIFFTIGLLTLGWTPIVAHTSFLEPELALRRSLEKSLFTSERTLSTYRALVCHASAGIGHYDDRGKATFVNDALAQLFEKPAEQLIGKHHDELFDEANLEKLHLELGKIKSRGLTQFYIQIKTQRQNRPVFLNIATVDDRQSKGSVWIFLDARDHKRMEKQFTEQVHQLDKTIKTQRGEMERISDELQSSKKYHESLMACTQEIILTLDKKGRCTFINRYGEKLLGFKAKELMPKRLPAFIADLEKIDRNYGVAAKLELHDYEAEIKTRTRGLLTCLWNVRALDDNHGGQIGIVCTGRDITEIKNLQRRLNELSYQVEDWARLGHSELKDQLDQISKIMAFEKSLALGAAPDKFLNQICQALRKLGWRVVVMALIEEKTGQYRVNARAGVSEERLDMIIDENRAIFKNPGQFFTDDNRISQSYYIKSKKGLLANIFVDNEIWSDKDILIIPIKPKHKIIGFITLTGFEKNRTPDEREIQFWEMFALRAGHAVESHRHLSVAASRAESLAQDQKDKARFFAVMSHELRTPLNSIVSLTSVMANQLSGPLNSEQRRQVQIIQQNAENLLSTINSLLDLSRLDNGRMELDYSYFLLDSLIASIVEMIRPLCQKKGLKLEVGRGKNIPRYIFNDREKINHTLTNIMSNAVKYTEKGKISLKVRIQRPERKLLFSISDTGIGMKKEEIEKIFQPFTRLDRSLPQKAAGTGLGLHLARQFWDLLGGTIEVDSRPGRGTTFNMWLPMKEIEGDVVPESPVKKSYKPKRTVSLQAKKRALILLVDDNPDNQYAVNFILQEMGHKVLFAGNGEEAIEKALKGNPDLILLDMMMPGLDGYQAAQRLRAHKAMKEIPIIAMTAQTAEEDKRRAIRCGCNDYLSKPFTMEQISQKVVQWLGGKL